MGGIALLFGFAVRWFAIPLIFTMLVAIFSVLGFMLLNARFPWNEKARVFLGDSGSTLLGFLLAWVIRNWGTESQLLTGGTAICGGTTIATLAPVIRARPESVGICLAIVFLLNALAILVLPPVGHWLGMTQAQFGSWVALAIHDTSSVVGAAAIYGEEALEIATTVKLARTLWLIPLVLVQETYKNVC